MHYRTATPGAQKGQAQGSDHKKNGSRSREFGQKRRCPGAAEKGLAGAAKGRPDTGAPAGLKQDDEDQRQTDDNVDDRDNGYHKKFI